MLFYLDVKIGWYWNFWWLVYGEGKVIVVVNLLLKADVMSFFFSLQNKKISTFFSNLLSNFFEFFEKFPDLQNI